MIFQTETADVFRSFPRRGLKASAKLLEQDGTKSDSRNDLVLNARAPPQKPNGTPTGSKALLGD